MKKNVLIDVLHGFQDERNDAETDTTLHDDLLLPPGCKSFDEWAEGDMDELLGRE